MLKAASRLDLLVVLAALVAFIVIEAPRLPTAPLDGHSWRQSLAASVVRSYRCGEPLFSPRLDACGEGENAGVQAMEFPLYAWTMAKVGLVTGAHRGERLVALFGGLAFLLGAAWIVRREGGLGGAACAAILSSALFLFYADTLIPDVLADGVTLLGAAVLLSGGRRRIVLGSLLMSLGIATKLVAAPLAVFTGTALLLRLRDRETRRDRALDLALHVLFVSLLPLAWYAGWNPHLQSLGECQLFWTKLEHPLQSITAALPSQVHARLAELFGNGWRIATYVSLAIVLFFRRIESLPLFLTWLATALFWAMLGWHHDAHEYDTVMFLAPSALTIGLAIGSLLGKINERAAIALTLALPLICGVFGIRSALPDLPRRLKTEQPVLTTLGAQLDTLLDPGESLHVPNAGPDPRVSYFTARRTWNGPLDCAHPKADCALVLRDRAPVCGKAATWSEPGATLTCGLLGRAPRTPRSLGPAPDAIETRCVR